MTNQERYPNKVITDWCGNYIDPKIRNHIGIGNIVRIPIDGCTMYFRITGKCKQAGWFVGQCEDPYYGKTDSWWMKGSKFPCVNGDIRRFSKHHVMEIPLDWNANKRLEKHAIYRREKRAYTGSL